MIIKFWVGVYFLKTKKLFLTIAEKRQITEIVFGGYGLKRRLAAAIDILSVYFHNNRLHVKFGCSRAVLKFGSQQLKNGKITGKKWKIGQKSVKKRSNGLVLPFHGSSLLLYYKKIIGL